MYAHTTVYSAKCLCEAKFLKHFFNFRSNIPENLPIVMSLRCGFLGKSVKAEARCPGIRVINEILVVVCC